MAGSDKKLFRELRAELGTGNELAEQQELLALAPPVGEPAPIQSRQYLRPSRATPQSDTSVGRCHRPVRSTSCCVDIPLNESDPDEEYGITTLFAQSSSNSSSSSKARSLSKNKLIAPSSCAHMRSSSPQPHSNSPRSQHAQYIRSYSSIVKSSVVVVPMECEESNENNEGTTTSHSCSGSESTNKDDNTDPKQSCGFSFLDSGHSVLQSQIVSLNGSSENTSQVLTNTNLQSSEVILEDISRSVAISSPRKRPQSEKIRDIEAESDTSTKHISEIECVSAKAPRISIEPPTPTLSGDAPISGLPSPKLMPQLSSLAIGRARAVQSAQVGTGSKRQRSISAASSPSPSSLTPSDSSLSSLSPELRFHTMNARTHCELVATLNAAFGPHLDFSRARPDQFARELDIFNVKANVEAYLSPLSTYREVRDAIWPTIENEITIDASEIYRFDMDPEGEGFSSASLRAESALVRSFCYLFYNRRARRIVLFASRATSVRESLDSGMEEMLSFDEPDALDGRPPLPFARSIDYELSGLREQTDKLSGDRSQSSSFACFAHMPGASSAFDKPLLD